MTLRYSPLTGGCAGSAKRRHEELYVDRTNSTAKPHGEIGGATSVSSRFAHVTEKKAGQFFALTFANSRYCCSPN